MRNARNIRESRGLTLERVALETGIGFSNLSRFERGLMWFGEENMNRLRDYYGCTIDELVAELPEPESGAEPAPAGGAVVLERGECAAEAAERAGGVSDGHGAENGPGWVRHRGA